MDHAAVIAPRRRGAPLRPAPARGRFLASAAGDAGVDAGWHGLRWGIESWCRGLESARIRTRSESPAGRAPCLAYSLVIPGAWVMAMVLVGLASRAAARGARTVHAGFCDAAAGPAGRGPPPGAAPGHPWGALPGRLAGTPTVLSTPIVAPSQWIRARAHC